jgi:hypothetical protein
MSISAISSGVSLAQLLSTQASSSTRATSQAGGGGKLEDMMADLQEAIDSGDIGAAKEAYQRIFDSAPDGWEDSPMAVDLEAVGEALNSGDADAASEALKTVTDKMAKGPQGPPPPPPTGADSSTDSTSLYSLLTSDGTTDESTFLGTLLDMTV